MSANYNDPGFVAYLRQQGVAGKKVPRAQAEALWSEYSGQQQANTQRAQQILTPLPDTPNARAASQQQAQPISDGLFEMGIVGRQNQNPIYEVAEQVTQQEAQAVNPQTQPQAQQRPSRDWGSLQSVLNARQLERASIKPLMENKYRTKETDAALREATAKLTNRYAKSSKDLANFGILDLKTFDALADEPIEIRAKAQQIVNDQLDRGEVPEWLTAIEQVKSKSGMATSPDGKTVNPRANLWWEYGQATEALEKNPDDPAAKALVGKLGQQLAGEKDPTEHYKHLQNVNMALADVGKLEASNVYDNTGLTSVFDGSPIEGKDAVNAYKQQLVNNRVSTTGFMQNRPETWSAVPSPQQFRDQGKSIADYAKYVTELPDNAVYIDPNSGSLAVKGVLNKSGQRPVITGDNPFSRAVQAEDELETSIARSGKEKKLEQRRQEMASLEADASRMAENPTARGNIVADYSALTAGRMIGGAIPPVPSRESAKLKAERYAILKQEVEALERELGIVQ